MRTSFWRAVGLGLGLFLAAAPGGVAEAQGTVRAGSLVFRDVGYDDPKLGSIKAGSVELRGVVREGDGFRADSASVTDLVFSDAITTTTIPSLTIDRPSGAKALLDILGGSGGRIDWIGFLSTAAADRIAADVVRRRVVVQGTTTEVTMNRPQAEGLAAGRLATLAFDGQEGRTEGPDPARGGTFKVGAIRYEDVDLAESLRFDAGGGDGPAKLLLGRGRVEGMAFEGANGDFRISLASLEMKGVFGRALREPFDRADYFRLGATNPPDPAVLRRLGAMAGDLAQTFRLDEASFEDLTVEAPGTSVKIAAFKANQYSFRSADLLEVRDLVIRSAGGDASFGRLAFEKLDYSRVVDTVTALLASGGKPNVPPRAVLGLIPVGTFRIDNIEASSPTAQSSGIGSFVIETAGSGDLIDAFTATLTGAVVDVAALPPTDGTAKLIELGYPTINFDAGFGLRYDETARTLTLERAGGAVADAGSVAATLRIASLDVNALLDAGFNGAAARAMQAPFGSLVVEVDDLGLGERFYASVAKTAGVSADAIRDGLAAEMRNQAARLLGPSLAPGAADAVAQFLKSSGKLTIRVEPRADRPPLTIGDVQALSPPQLADRVSVTMQASTP